MSTTILTQKEVDTLRAIVEYGSHKICADKLGISKNSIKNRVLSINIKLGTPTTIQAVYQATKKGII